MLISSSVLLVFCAVGAVAVYTPGPAVMLAIHNGVNYGWQRSLLSSLGNISGLLLLSTASGLGLGALLLSSVLLFTVLKVVGAGYLIYLGIKQWRQAKKSALAIDAIDLSVKEAGSFELYREGILLALTNPKAILFITALFPQFINHDQALFPQFALLTALFMALSFSSLMFYAALGRFARGRCASILQSKRFKQSTAGIFVLLGIGLLQLKASS